MIAPQSLPPQQPLAGLSHTRFRDFDSFDAAISSSFVPLSIAAPSSTRFQGGLRNARAGGVIFSEIGASAHEVHRDETHIQAGGDGFLKLSIMMAGHGLLVQDNREVMLGPGDIAVHDTARPYTLAFSEDFLNFVVMLPRETIEVPADLIAELTATHLARDSAMGTLVSQTLPNMPGAIAQSSEFARCQLARTTTELITAFLSAFLGQTRLDQDPRQVLIRKVRSYISDNLQSPDLGPDRIAAAHYVSPRRLHGLFQGEAQTIAATIRTLRLERCHADLLNPAYADRSVSAIASRWCFLDAAHFSRAFRSHFGVSPRDLRASR